MKGLLRLCLKEREREQKREREREIYITSGFPSWYLVEEKKRYFFIKRKETI